MKGGICMNNLNISQQELPVSVVAFYIEINETKNIIVNTKFDEYTQRLGFFGCLYYHCKGATVAQITAEDLNKENFEPIIYAKEKLNCFTEVS
jgi:hypothetical protein